jgi:hypothetical protein
MGALSPLFLIAGAVVAVPIFLHLFHRQEVRRVSFPALRYLERTEREHARRIRTRQLLLLLLRITAVLLLVGAGARLFLRGRGSAHPPTALAIVLDNSMSSGVVLGDRRFLDDLKAVALRTLAAASDDDRVWVVRAGEPWLPAVPGTPAEARRTVEETEVSEGRGDLSRALARAAELVRTSGMGTAEVHLLSDLQATSFDDDVDAPAGNVPVVVWSASDDLPANRGLARVVVGGGLPPLGGRRGALSVDVTGAEGDTVPVPVRLVLDESVRGAGAAAPGSSLSLPLPPAPTGWVRGYADADPDALRADDRCYFAYRARPAPRVAVAGDPGVFVTEALAVLQEADRLQPTGPTAADAVISGSGELLEAVPPAAGVLIVPPLDAALLPALNRRLANAGIPWTFARRDGGAGEVDLVGDAVPEPLASVRVTRAYRLTLEGDPPAPPRTLAHAGGTPWAVEGSDARGRRYLLLASPLDAESTTLPVSADMVRFLDWFTGQWAAAAGAPLEHVAGEPLPAPYGADHVRLPSGDQVAVDGTRTVLNTDQTGFYTFLAGDSTVAVEAVNPPSAESDLTRIARDALEGRVGTEVTEVRRTGAWERAIFRARQGPELWRPLLLVALLLLLLESAIAAAGRVRKAERAGTGGEAARGAT